ncbi:exo-beta-D-glucosaminidase [Abditibacteriota bacterium]|nr:exo-beta-D-glucosaminidase [Abditibacteriota bacterium]
MFQFQIRVLKPILFSASLLLTGEAIAQEQPTVLDLDSANKAIQWKVEPQSVVGDDSSALFAANYDTTQWVAAQVPGTAFTSYVTAGLEKDPNFGDNIYRVDKTKYDRDFWYRAQFRTPTQLGATAGKKVWLNFEGINRKGDVYFNGASLGRLDGFMQRGKFDITSLLRKDQNNVLAVLVHWPGLPIPNRASPTYISSASWDWMPYVPGLLSGITDDVYLSTSGQVSLVDPWVRTDLPTTTKAELSFQVGLANHSTQSETGVLSGVIQPGGIKFSQPVTLAPQETKTVTLDKSTFKQLTINNPNLWWPNGYGEPNLYHCDLTFSVRGKLSDSKRIQFGIKKYSYDTRGDVFHLHINGKPIFVKGGNWGMSEYLLRSRGTEYDLKVKLHRDMNFNMIRNWIGSTTDDEFYQACDKYGIMVWDDFWLNSHPNLPEDVNAFRANAIEKIKRLRNHPSVAIWCGDNEGTPLPPLNDWLREDVQTYDSGDRWYQPRSNMGALSGSGPWANMDTAWYFTKYPRNYSNLPSWGMRSEIGTAVFTNVESFKKFIPQDKWWPRNEMWNQHFFGPSAGNGGPDRYEETITRSYGQATGIEDWCRKAQLLNIETNKAMFEGWQHNMWDDASGILTWMSQSAYPSFVWQTYDYYYDLTGAYWGAKKACEPIHVQWNSGDNSVKVINTTSTDLKNLTVQASVFNIDGKSVPALALAKTVKSAPSDSAVAAFDLNFNKDNLAYKAPVVASSDEGDGKTAEAAVDGGSGSRWSSKYEDDQWIYVDLGATKTINEVNLLWESAYGKSYKIQVSDDKNNWRDVYATDDGDGGTDKITIPPTSARYVRMLGLKRGSPWGYSLYEFEVYATHTNKLSDTHFIELKLKDSSGRLLSDNFYWRSTKSQDYTAINSMTRVNLDVRSKTAVKDGKTTVAVKITNPASSPSAAFAIRVIPVKASNGEQILPAMMNDNYFSLMRGESRDIRIEFDKSLLGTDQFKLKVEPYNNR